MPITRQVYCSGSSPLLTTSLCRQLPAARAPTSTHEAAGEPSPKSAPRCLHISLLAQLSIRALACSDFKGPGRSPPVLAVLCAEFLPGLHPASAGFPSQPPSLQARPKKA